MAKGGGGGGRMFCYFTLLDNVAQTFLWYRHFAAFYCGLERLE